MIPQVRGLLKYGSYKIKNFIYFVNIIKIIFEYNFSISNKSQYNGIFCDKFHLKIVKNHLFLDNKQALFTEILLNQGLFIILSKIQKINHTLKEHFLKYS